MTTMRSRLIIVSVLAVMLASCASPIAPPTGGGTSSPAADAPAVDTAPVDCTGFLAGYDEIDLTVFDAGFGFTPPEPDCLGINGTRDSVSGVYDGAGHSTIDDFVEAATAAGWTAGPDAQFPERTRLKRGELDGIAVDLLPEGVKFHSFLIVPIPEMP
jgi:hypothetical protein